MGDAAEQIWYVDPRGLLRDDRLGRFVPEPQTPLAQQLNAVLRFSLYYAAVAFIFQRSTNSLLVPLVVALVTFLVHQADAARGKAAGEVMERLDVAVDSRDRGRNSQLCTRPTLNNPFMNVLMSDFSQFPERPEACDITNTRVHDKAEELAAHNLYKDSDDVFDRSSSSRAFFTTPSTTIPNDQGGFAKWLYGTDATCKEAGGATSCYANVFRQPSAR